MKIKSEFIRNVLTLATGIAIAQAIPIAVSPVLSRLYSPDEFGLYALFMSVAGIIAVIATGCYEYAIMLPENDNDAINIVALSTIITFFVSFTSLLVLWQWNREIAQLLNNAKVSKWLYFVPLAVFFRGIYQSYQYWFNRKKQFGTLSVNAIAQNTASSGIKLSLGFGGFGASGLVAGDIIGSFISAGLLGRQAYRDDAFQARFINRKTIIQQAIRYKRFPAFSSLSGFFNTVSMQMPIILLSSFFSNSIAGFYFFSFRLLNMPMSLLGISVGQVFFQKASECKKDKEKIKEVTFSVYKRLLLIGIIPMTFIMVYGDYIFSFVFGGDWKIAGEYARVLSPWILLVFISAPLSSLFDIFEKQKEELVFNNLIFVARVVAIVVGGMVFRDAYIAILLFGTVSAVLWLWCSCYLLNLAHVDYMESFVFTLIIVLGVGGVLFLARYMMGL
jgi:lipopolysaccharide exporter